MRKLWQDEAWEEYLYWQTQDKKTLKKINRLLTDIDRNGYECTGKPEPLSGNLAGYWSVRIDEKNRIVFRIDATISHSLLERLEAKKRKRVKGAIAHCLPLTRFLFGYNSKERENDGSGLGTENDNLRSFIIGF